MLTKRTSAELNSHPATGASYRVDRLGQLPGTSTSPGSAYRLHPRQVPDERTIGPPPTARWQRASPHAGGLPVWVIDVHGSSCIRPGNGARPVKPRVAG